MSEAEQGRGCTLCGGVIGPDIMGRPMCYSCGPIEMKPASPRIEQRNADAALLKEVYSLSPSEMRAMSMPSMSLRVAMDGQPERDATPAEVAEYERVAGACKGELPRIAGTPSTMLGEALAHYRRARTLVEAAKAAIGISVLDYTESAIESAYREAVTREGGCEHGRFICPECHGNKELTP